MCFTLKESLLKIKNIASAAQEDQLRKNAPIKLSSLSKGYRNLLGISQLDSSNGCCLASEVLADTEMKRENY
tara:strand:- start:1169 stop:1384 length:216 start_codon:yes stop_codon:yes gene_type:complete